MIIHGASEDKKLGIYYGFQIRDNKDLSGWSPQDRDVGGIFPVANLE